MIRPVRASPWEDPNRRTAASRCESNSACPTRQCTPPPAESASIVGSIPYSDLAAGRDTVRAVLDCTGGCTFDELRTGLDHVSFSVAASELDTWQRRLGEEGIGQSEPAPAASGELVIVVRDPDNIQLRQVHRGLPPRRRPLRGSLDAHAECARHRQCSPSVLMTGPATSRLAPSEGALEGSEQAPALR